MSFRPTHPSDEELLLIADRECSPRRAAKVREHLAECPPCAVRLMKLEATLADFLAFNEGSAQSQAPARAGSRAALRVRLSRAACGSNALLPSPFVSGRLAWALAALLIVAGSLWAMRDAGLRRLNPNAADPMAIALPRKQLTPGAVRAVPVDELCRGRSVEDLTPVDASIESQVFAEYGLQASARHGYELDYLITPELGGAADIHNLWPEPYSSISWNAHVKDELEGRLHEMVCEGKLPLAAAQEAIASDWIAAYKRYFHTDVPLSNAAALGAKPTPVVEEASAGEIPAL